MFPFLMGQGIASLPPPSVFGLPYDTWRPHQDTAIEQALDARTRFVAVQAPTGSGKTGIAAGVALLSGDRSAILTAAKGLQDQYQREIGTALVDVRGAGNYECLEGVNSFAAQFAGRRIVGCDEGPCTVGESCHLKRVGCLYYDRVRSATAAPITLTNYAYWLAARRFADGLGLRSWIILDEAHDAAEQLRQHLRVVVSQAQIGVPLPTPSAELPAWRAWAADLIPVAQGRAERGTIRNRLHWKRQLTTLKIVASMRDGDWIWMHQDVRAIFEPLQVQPYVRPLLVAKADRVLLLSATLTDGVLCDLGIDDEEVTWIKLPSLFPVRRRPVIVDADCGRIDHRMDETRTNWWVSRMQDILDARRDRKGIIHSISYARQQLLMRKLSGWEYFAPQASKDLPRVLHAFRQAGPGSLLIAPNVVTGFDFPGPDAEFQIIAKVPFPDTRSPIMQARLTVDAALRDTIALQTIIQAAGRIMRSASDQGETFIMDEHAIWFLRKHRRTLPLWFLKAVKMTVHLPDPPPPLSQES